MLPTSHRTEAAIAVIDEKNIEEAIKTAIKTAEILREEQKQIALMILNMKKLDVSMLKELMKRNEDKNKAALAAQQTIKLDKQNMEDAKKALEASNKAEGQQQVLQAGNYLLYDILQSVSAGNKAQAHMAASMAAYYDSKVQEQAESERILANYTNLSKKWVENLK